MHTEWTENDVSARLANPIYAGIGHYEAIVEDDVWLDANVRRIQEEGAAPSIKITLKHFEEAFSGLSAPNAEPYIQQAKTDLRAALRRLLTDLRDLAEEETE